MLKNRYFIYSKKNGGKTMMTEQTIATTTTQKSVLYRQINMLCAERGITLAQLAKMIDVTPQNLYGRLERERLTYSELSKIAEVLGCTFSYNFQPLNQ